MRQNHASKTASLNLSILESVRNSLGPISYELAKTATKNLRGTRLTGWKSVGSHTVVTEAEIDVDSYKAIATIEVAWEPWVHENPTILMWAKVRRNNKTWDYKFPYNKALDEVARTMGDLIKEDLESWLEAQWTASDSVDF